MDDALLVSMLYAFADLDHQLEALTGSKPIAITVRRDLLALDQLHREVRTTARRLTGIEHPGHVGVVHQCQSLTLGLETRHDLLGVHALLDDLDRHPTPDRLRLQRLPHFTHATFAELLQEAVGTDL